MTPFENLLRLQVLSTLWPSEAARAEFKTDLHLRSALTDAYKRCFTACDDETQYHRDMTPCHNRSCNRPHEYAWYHADGSPCSDEGCGRTHSKERRHDR